MNVVVFTILIAAVSTACIAPFALPLAWRGLLSGVLLAYCRAIGEFGATILVAGNIPGRTQTIALAIYDRVQEGRDADAALLVLYVVLIAASLTGFSTMLIHRHDH